MLPRELLKDVRKIEIKTGHLVDSIYSGGYRSIFKGSGIEFSGIRQYYRGDEFRAIDWKVSARTGNLHIREHIEERELQVVIAMDLSASMSFGTGSREKRETAVEFAAAMAMAAARNNDRAGACLFSGKVEKFLVPSKGKTHILRLIRELLYFLPEGKTSDLRPALHFLNRSLNRRSVVFVITDGIDLPPMERELKTTFAHHDLIMVLVVDRREREMPDIGLIEIEDPETGEELIWDTSDRRRVKAFLDEMQRRRASFHSTCKKMGIDSLEITAGESVIQPICRLFADRERRSGR